MEVNDNCFRLDIGKFKCLVISDGIITVPGKAKESNTPTFMEPGSVMDAMCLLVRTGKQIILMDTGLGVGGQPKAGKVIQNLQAEGISCKDINIVIISHCHGDHIGGLIDSKSRLVYSNARFIMCKEEWEFWTSDPELRQLKVDEGVRHMFCKTVQENLIPIKNQLDLIDSETLIVPGIKCIKAPGHTPGNIVLSISSDAEKLLYTGDLFHNPVQLGEPHLHDVFDFDPEQAGRTRMHMLSKVITPGTMVATAHFPFPGIGHVMRKDKAWRWQPI